MLKPVLIAGNFPGYTDMAGNPMLVYFNANYKLRTIIVTTYICVNSFLLPKFVESHGRCCRDCQVP